jgi:hypothetical protein
MKNCFAFSLASVLAGILCLGLVFACFGQDAVSQVANPQESKQLPKPGEKVPLDADHYFIYGFDKAPKLGTAIMRVEIFATNGSRDTTFAVTGDVDMPSMKGAHSTGNKPFSLSKKGVYLLPVPIAMPGEWELKFTFEKDGKRVFQGSYRFEV